MKKIFVTMIFILLMQSVSLGATSVQSEDMSVYVRQDVFDAKMEALFNRLHSELVEFRSEIKTEMSEIRGDIKALSEKIDGVNKSLNEKIDGVNKSLTEKIDGVNKSLSEKIDGVEAKLSARIDGIDKRIDELDKRIDDLRNGFYVGIVVFGTLLGLPIFNKLYSERKAQKEKSSFTLEDVKRLIEENNIMLRQNLLRS